MKLPLLACALIALSGCSSKPSNSEIEEYLEPLFSSCDNIKFGSASKTNGYGDVEAYHVQFGFTIKVDADKLEKLHAAFIKDRDASAKFTVSYARFKERLEKATAELDALTKEFEAKTPAPSLEDFPVSGSAINVQNEPYQTAMSVWQTRRNEYLKPKQAEIEALESEGTAMRRQVADRTFANTERIGEEMWNFYPRGCSMQAVRFLRGMLQETVSAPEEWFDRRKFDFTGELVMRKTEQGWRVVGA